MDSLKSCSFLLLPVGGEKPVSYTGSMQLPALPSFLGERSVRTVRSGPYAFLHRDNIRIVAALQVQELSGLRTSTFQPDGCSTFVSIILFFSTVGGGVTVGSVASIAEKHRSVAETPHMEHGQSGMRAGPRPMN